MNAELSSSRADADALRAFSAKLQSVGAEARKLLAQIVELAYSETQAEREKDTAYVPEILESCGLDVDHMYSLLRELEGAELVRMESQYPFEKVKLENANLLRSLREMSLQRKTSLRDVLVEGKFEF